MENRLIIAIDGPGAAGKSTVAKKVAKDLHLTYIDTGAMYRCLALYALMNQLDINNEQVLADAVKKIDIFLDQNGKVFLNHQDVTKEIRTREVTNIVSKVSYPRAVRELFVAKQQELATQAISGVVMDGRDIGTVVLPNANLKIYQVASSKIRAQRRYEENLLKGITTPVEIIQKEIEERDYLDKNKGFGALKQAEDAILLDTSEMSVDEAAEFIIKKAKELI